MTEEKKTASLYDAVVAPEGGAGTTTIIENECFAIVVEILS